MSKWLERLKGHKGLVPHATKPTEPGSVGFGASMPGTFEKSHGEGVPPVAVHNRAAVSANDSVQPTVARVVAATSPKTSCSTCTHATKARTCAKPEEAGLVDRFRMVWLDSLGNHGVTCQAHRAQEPRQAFEEVPRLTAAQQRAVSGWDEAEIAKAGRYMRQVGSHGLAAEVAERITDLLMLRDRQKDDRHMCLECTQLDRSGRCAAARTGRLAGAANDLQPVKVTLMRCPGFQPISKN